VQIASDVAKGCAARLSGVEPPKYEDNEASLADLRARLEKTIAFIEGVDRLAVEAAASGTVTFKTGGRDLTMKSVDYVNHYVFPNVYFHLTMVYALVRQAGVPVGKMDFLGAIG